jgi:hypothetical protein
VSFVGLLLALVLAVGPRTAVLDASAPDAIYEDVSRALADDAVAALAAAGLSAHRVEEDELPEGGCRSGPCLERVAQAQRAEVLVVLDAREVGRGKAKSVAVGVLALDGRTGRPLAGQRYTAGPRARAALTAFAGKVARAVAAADGG